jgi:hypothetical protein
MAKEISDAQGIAPPRLYDESDESEDAATLLHSSARPPRQEHTALLPAGVPTPPLPVAMTAPPPPEPVAVRPHEPRLMRPHEPIPYNGVAPFAEDGDEPEPRIMIMPLVVGFLIFAIGLAFYIWAR